MGSQRLKEDVVHKISTSVFVTNFADQSNAKDLWNACKQYRYVVDAFIPNRRSKACKRFGFVRFIKRASLNNSSSQFRYNGEKTKNVSDVSNNKGVKDSSNSYAHVVKGRPSVNGEVDSNPALVLDESCLNVQDYSRCLMGKVKDLGSLSNLKVVLGSEGFDNIVIRYLGRYWVMIEFLSEELKKKFQSNVGIGTWFSHFQQASIDFNIDGRVTWVELEAKEVPGWVLDFVKQSDEENESDDENLEGELNGDILRSDKDLKGDNELNAVPDTVFEEELAKSNGGEASVGQNEMQSEDPFDIYTLLNKKKEDNNKVTSTNDSLKYPHGFTPREDVVTDVGQSKQRNECVREIGEEVNVSIDMKSGLKKSFSKEDGTESVCSGHFKKSETPRSGGSILLFMDELVKVGQTMGYNMDGCMKNIEEIIESQGVNKVYR
ncbi:nucleotide-binding alpha-beta plait domain-containing protein [Tanacetum coccineum]